MSVQVAYHNDNWACYRVVNGRYRLFLGCAHRIPSSAIAHSKTLEARSQESPSPTRSDDGLSEAQASTSLLEPARALPSEDMVRLGHAGTRSETAASPGGGVNAAAGDFPEQARLGL